MVIFGDDGTYSINNSDETKLGISKLDGYLILTPLAPGNVVVTISDGRNNSYSLKVEIKSQLRVKMNVKEKEGEIFDLMEFNLFSYSEKDFTLLDLTEVYDSLVWGSTKHTYEKEKNSLFVFSQLSIVKEYASIKLG